MTGALTLSLFCVLLAQDKPKLAIHPLQVQAERHEADLRIRFAQEVLQHSISSMGTRQIPTWLAKRPKASCMGQEACLVQMAEAMGATYALYVSLVVGEEHYEMSAKVVRADGELVRHIEKVSYPRDLQKHWGDDVQEAFKVLLGQLRPEALPVHPLMLAAVEKEAEEKEEGAEKEEEELIMELDLQESEDEQTSQGLRKSVGARKGKRPVRGGGAEMGEDAEKGGGRQGGVGAVSQKGALRVIEPLTGWAPASSTWTKPRYMELYNKPAPLRMAAYVVTGVSGTLFLTSGIFWLMAASQQGFLEKNVVGNVVVPGTKPREVWDAHKKAQLYPTVGTYLAVSGAVFAGAAAALFILSYVFEEGLPFALAPMKGGVSLGIRRRF